MAKIRKSKLSWHPSESAQIAFYRLYWSTGHKPSYDSESIELGMVTEVFLHDVLKDVPYTSEPVMFGITAVDINGNESDIVTLPKPCHLTGPPAPEGFSLKFLNDYEVIEAPGDKASDQFDMLFEEDTRMGELNESARKEEPLSGS